MADRGHDGRRPINDLDGDTQSTVPFSSPASTSTPPPPPAAAAKEASLQSSSSSSSSSPGTRAQSSNIHRTWPTSIDVPQAKAVAQWDQPRPGRLPGLSFDLHWHLPSSKAFFRLHASLACKNKNGGRRKISIHLLIHPERIRRMVALEDPGTWFGADTLALTFHLARPPALVLPRTPCEPKNQRAAALLESFRALAGRLCFTVFANVSRRTLPQSRVRELCASASNLSLGALMAYADTTSLYRGQGGQVIEGTSTDAADAAAASPTAATATNTIDQDPPPDYEDGDKDSDQDSRRRRRRNSDTTGRLKGADPRDEDVPLPGATPDTVSDALKQHFDLALQAHEERITRLLHDAERRILDGVSRRVGELVQSKVEGALDDGIDCRIADLVDAKLLAEREDLEESIMQNILEEPVEVTMAFPNRRSL